MEIQNESTGTTPVSVRLTNSSGHSIAVDIVNTETGVKDVVFLQPGGRPKLALGFRIDPVFAARNPQVSSFEAS